MTTPDYEDFLQPLQTQGPRGLAAVYHAVRKIPYGSTGERDPVKVLAGNLGSCSGKHILLRDVLRRTGRRAEVITMFTHFNRGIASHPAMPPDLRAMIEGVGVCDFHHYVRVDAGSFWVKLDATWHDALIPYGFPVNHDWQGSGDTVLAATAIREYPAVEDLAALKVQLLAELEPPARDLRARFFQRLTEWIATL